MAKVTRKDGKIIVTGAKNREEAYRAAQEFQLNGGYENFSTTGSVGSSTADALTKWRNTVVGRLNQMQSRSQSWFDSSTYETQKSQLDNLRSQADSWKRIYKDNSEATSFINSVTAYLDHAVTAWAQARKYYSQWDSADSYQWQQRVETADLGSVETSLKDLALQVSEAKDARNAAWWDLLKTGTPESASELTSRFVEQFDLQAQQSEQTSLLNQARRLQERRELASVADASSDSFDPYLVSKGKYQSDTGDDIYEYINGRKNGKRDEINRKYQDDQAFQNAVWDVLGMDTPIPATAETPYQAAGYDYMTDDEVNIYNYYYAQEGREKAASYLKSIQETLNLRKATGHFESMEDQTALELMFGAAAGLDQFESGVKAFGNTRSDYIAPSVAQLASQMVREDLSDVGGKLPDWLGGGSIGQGAYDFITTTANMTPSILSSMAANAIVPGSGTIVGNAAMFASSAGNAYQEALNAGYDKKQARFYSSLVGASEVGLQSVLGGISALGGSGKAVANMVDGINTAYLRIAAKWAGSAASEGLEEGLQEILTPVFKELALHVHEDVNWNEVAYSALLGALSGGVLEGRSIIREDRSTSRTGQQVMGAENYLQRLQELGHTMSADSAAYKLAGKVDANTGAYTIGKMFNEIGAELSQQNRRDIADQLVQRGFTARQAEANAKAFADVVAGAPLSKKQAATLDANDILSEVIIDSIIDPNSTVYQRTNHYNELLMDMARSQTAQTAADPSAAEMPELQEVAEQTAAQQLEQEAQAARQGSAALVATREPVTVTGIASMEGGSIRLNLADGQDVAIGDLDLGDGAPVYEAAASIADDPETATRLAKGFAESPVSGAEYAMALRHAYRLGQILPREQALRSGLISALPSDIQTFAVELGQQAGNQKLAADTTRANAKTRPAVKRNEQKGYLIDPDNLRAKASDTQLDDIDAIAFIADTLQIPIHLYESEMQNGRRVGANGWYDPSDGSIHIDIHAGMDGEGTMLFTLAHELTHQMRDWDPQKFRALADFLISEYGKKGVKVDELIENKLPSVLQTYKDKGFSEEQLYDIAYEEVVADSMEPMLTDGRVIQKMKARDSTTWAFMRDFIREIADKIRTAYAKLKPNSAEGKHVAAMKDSIEAIEDLFLEGVESASAKASGAQKNTAREDGGAASTKYSMRDVDIKRIYIQYGNVAEERKIIERKASDLIRRGKTVVIDEESLPVQKSSFNWIDKKENRKYLRSILAPFSGRSVFFNHGGSVAEAYLTGKGIDHSVVGLNSPEKSAAFSQFYKLVKQAEYVFSSKNDSHNNSNKNIAGKIDWDSFIAIAVFGEEPFPVLFKIRTVDSDARSQIYKIAAKNEIGSTSDHGQQQKLSDNLPTYGTKPISESIIAQDAAESQEKNILYQQRSNQMHSFDESIRQENEQLKEDFDETKAVFRIMGISEKDGIFTRGSVTAVAQGLIKLAGAKRKTGELTDLLTRVYADLASRKNLTWSQAEEALTQVVDWLMDNRQPELDSFAQDVLDAIRGQQFYLDDAQLQDAQYAFGSYNKFRRAVMNKATIDPQKGTPLDSLWQEWAEAYPSIFDPNTNANDMPRALAEAIAKLRDMTTDRTMGFDVAGLRQELLRETYDGLIRAAVYPADADRLMTWKDVRLQGLTEEREQQVRRVLEKHEKQMAKLRQRQELEIVALKENYRRQQEWRKDSRERTELRHRIQRTVDQLNSMLIRETKNLHVPEVLKMAVVEALEAVNMDTVNAEARIQKLQNQLEKTTDQDKAKELQERIATLQEMGGRVDKKLARLEEAYREIKAAADPDLDYAFDEEVLNQIQKVKELVGRKPLREMSKSELEAVAELYTVILTRVRSMNEAFATARKESISGMGGVVIKDEERAAKNSTGRQLSAVRVFGHEIQFPVKMLQSFFWNNEKPLYAFKRMASDTLTMLFHNVRKGEDVWALDVSEAKAFAQTQAKKYHVKDWDMKKRHAFTGINGAGFSLDLGQILTLYAYSKREQSWLHLEQGGFQFGPATKTEETKANGAVEVVYELTSTETYKVDAMLLSEIVGTLTAEQKAYADKMIAYLSDTMGAKGNEISMQLYGIKLFKEQFYFPLRSSKEFLALEASKAKGEVKIKNKGFTKPTQEYANNPVYLENFMDIWADHVNEMSMYHGFTLPLEDFYRVLNYQEGVAGPDEDGTAPNARGVRGSIKNAHGEAAVKYIEQLLKDLNSGALSDPREAPAKSLISKHKKAAVMASLSVLVQQPTALYRAMSVLDPKYFGAAPITRGLFRTANAKKHQKTWQELKQYAPVAIIKEMGYFDTNMGKSTRDYLMGTEYEGFMEKLNAFRTDANYRDEIFGRLPALADELAWVSIWEAVKKEQADKNKQLMQQDPDAFLQLCGERFTEVITQTQVYDSVMSRSANMRSKGVFMNMATSFMAEPTTIANMIEDAVRRGLQGDKKYCARVFGAVLGSSIVNSALVSLVYAMRDDDEDETFTEKYLSRTAAEILESLNPITYIPFAKDVWSIMQGFDVERADMALISDLISAANTRIGLAAEDVDSMSDEDRQEHEASVVQANWALVDVLGSLTGFPAKNIRRDVAGAANLLKTLTKDMNGRSTTATSLIDAVASEVSGTLPFGSLMSESKSKRLYDAVIAGDTDYVQRLKSGYKTEDSYNSALRKALREHDPRIRQAAELRVNGDLTGYAKLARTIVAEGRFTQDDVVTAVNAEVNAMKKDDGEDSAGKAKSLYDGDDIRTALLGGNKQVTSAVRDEIIRIEKVNGKTAEEAEQSFVTRITSTAKDLYLEGQMTDQKARSALMSYCELDQAEASAKVAEWTFEKRYGYSYSDRQEAYTSGKVSRAAMLSAMKAAGKTEKEAQDQLTVYDWQKESPSSEDISAPAIEAYNKYCASAGISKDQYYAVWDAIGEIDSDADSSGKAIKNSKTKKVMAYINSLSLTASQKTALALSQYAASTVRKYRLW